MIKFSQFLLERKSSLLERISRGELKSLERVLDRMYADMKLDVEFGQHFFDRVNDARNGTDITVDELRDLFTKAYNKYATEFQRHSQDHWEAVLFDVNSAINIPIMFKWNDRKQMIEVIGKTVMRKRNFMTRTKKLRV